jgi:tryptophan-rich sensory protein
VNSGFLFAYDYIMNKSGKLIVSIAIPMVIGTLSGLLTPSGDSNWYRTIEKPSWNPPSWVFAPVWTTLYLLMGIALFLVWKSEDNSRSKQPAFVLFGAQLILNFCWSFIFFSAHELGWALAELGLLWIFIILTMFAFRRFSRGAPWLMLPYICWVSFAGLLNYTVWQMNS